MYNETQHQPISPPPAPEPNAGIMQTIRDCMDFATLLRMGGALMVLAAMSAFILQDWGASNDISRYYLLLVQMFVLAGGGFGLSYLLKENKGARAFFGLSVLAVSANMATLGALIFSVTQWGSQLVYYPSFAKWQAVEGSSLALAAGCGIMAAIPVLLFGHSLFARRSCKTLAATALLTNLLLLVPVRDSVLLGGVALVAICLPLWVMHIRLKADETLRTPSGYFALASLFVPASIIIARSLWLYEADVLLELILSGLGFTLIHMVMRLLTAYPRFRALLDMASFGLAAAIAVSLTQLLDTVIFNELSLFMASAVFAGLCLVIGLRGETRKKFYIHIGALCMAVGNGLMLLDSGDLATALFCVLAGVGIATTGKLLQERFLLVLGSMLMVFGIGQQCYRIVAFVDFSSWITLSVLGVSAIVGASVVERHGAVIKYRAAQWMDGLKKKNAME